MDKKLSLSAVVINYQNTNNDSEECDFFLRGAEVLKILIFDRDA